MKRGQRFLEPSCELATVASAMSHTQGVSTREVGRRLRNALTSYSNLQINAGDQFREVGWNSPETDAGAIARRPCRASFQRLRLGLGNQLPSEMKLVSAQWEAGRKGMEESKLSLRVPRAIVHLVLRDGLFASPLPPKSRAIKALKSFQTATTCGSSSCRRALVASPCALAFDKKGRLFVAENRGYPSIENPRRA